MLAQGIYPGRVSKLFYSESQKKGTPCMVAVIDLGESTERSVKFWLTDANWEYVQPKLAKIGWNGDITNPSWHSDQSFEWECKHGSYNGKPQEEWDLAGFGGAPVPVVAPPDKTALWKSRFNAAGGAPKPLAPRPAAPPTPAPTNPTPPSRPLPSSPPTRPPETKIEPNFGNVTNKATAYEEHVRSSTGTKNETKINDDWWFGIGAVETKTGRKEDAFTADDWKQVLREIPPF